MTFTVSDKLVRERYGAEFDLSKWVEGVDYVRRRAFKGERVVFRKGFLDEDTLHRYTDTQDLSNTDIPREQGVDVDHVKTAMLGFVKKERPMIASWVESGRIAFLGGKEWEMVFSHRPAFVYLQENQLEYLSKCLVLASGQDAVLNLRYDGVDLIKCEPELEHNLERKVEFGGSGVYECKVTRLFPNQRYAGTDKGVVYVGGKPVKKGEILMAGDGIMLKKIKGTR